MIDHLKKSLLSTVDICGVKFMYLGKTKISNFDMIWIFNQYVSGRQISMNEFSSLFIFR